MLTHNPTTPRTGTFDFSLMAIAACVFAFDLDEALWSGVSLGIGACHVTWFLMDGWMCV